MASHLKLLPLEVIDIRDSRNLIRRNKYFNLTMSDLFDPKFKVCLQFTLIYEVFQQL